jgi:hypothetical protein
VFCDPKRESRRTITISGDEETPDGVPLASTVERYRQETPNGVATGKLLSSSVGDPPTADLRLAKRSLHQIRRLSSSTQIGN